MRRGFVIHHNGPPASCLGEPHERCERFWAAVRDYHVNTKGWSDIAYSFGVCPHGVRFTGRGWDKRQWANGADQVGPDDGGDIYWYTVLVFLGTDEAPTAEMVDGVKALIQEGRDWGRCMDRVLPHNAFKVKACPGPEFTAYAKAWDNQPLTEIDMPLTQDDANLVANEIVKRLTGDAASVNDLRDTKFMVAAIATSGGPDVDEEALAKSLAPLITPAALTHLSDDDIEAIAKKVNDEMHRRSAA